MQGIKPCKDCPYGFRCEKCPEDLVAKDPNARFEKGGFYTNEIVETIGPDGKKHYAYSHPE